MKKEKTSTKDLIGIKEVKEDKVLTSTEEIVFFMISPTNLSVLSEENIRAKIYALTNVIRSISNIEMICINSRENFANNKEYLRKRINEENNPEIRKLLLNDAKSLDELQIGVSTAREFLIIIKFRNNQEDDNLTYLFQIEKTLKEQGIKVKKADKDDIKRILGVYFEQNITTDYFENTDGERWVIFGDN